MTVEELLVPRYEVHADYPGMNQFYSHYIGDVLTDDGIHPVRNQHDVPVFAVEWKKYPHIYRQMGWYEKREESDMPDYVKWADEKGTRPAPHVRKVKSHFNKLNHDFRTHNVNQFLSEDDHTYTYSPFLPATEVTIANLRNNTI